MYLWWSAQTRLERVYTVKEKTGSVHLMTWFQALTWAKFMKMHGLLPRASEESKD